MANLFHGQKYVCSLSGPDKNRYIAKVELVSGKKYCDEVDPYQIVDWIDDIEKWPELEFGDIYTYLVDTKGLYTKASMKAYKSLESYNYYNSGWVQTVLLNRIREGLSVLKANVQPSQRMNDSPHVPWVAIKNKDGSVLTGHCTCMAGCGEVCSHVAAVLFKIEACTRLQLLKTCTSLPCMWNQAYSKKVVLATISSVNFTAPSKRRKLECKFTSRERQLSTFDFTPCISRETLLNAVYSSNPSAAIFTVVPVPVTRSPNSSQSHTCIQSGQSSGSAEESSEQHLLDIQREENNGNQESSDYPLDIQREENNPNAEEHPTGSEEIPSVSASIVDSSLNHHLPPLLSDLFNTENQNWSSDYIQEVCEGTFDALLVSQIQANNLAALTVHQSASQLWFQHRLGRITASNMHPVLRYTGRKYPKSIVNTSMQYKVINSTLPPLQWGRDNEGQARYSYEVEQRGKHENLEVTLSGLVINPLYPFIAASPDGIVSCNCCETRLLEIKCPYSLRHTSPKSEEALKKKGYCLMKGSRGDIMLSRKHCYYTQIQCQLLVTDKEMCDFVCWTQHGTFTETIYRDHNYCDKIVSKSKAFFFKFILPELLTHQFKDGIILEGAANKENEDTKYCFCKEYKEGTMIGCDGSNCEIEWFHCLCVGISQIPKGQWYCPNCCTSS